MRARGRLPLLVAVAATAAAGCGSTEVAPTPTAATGALPPSTTEPAADALPPSATETPADAVPAAATTTVPSPPATTAEAPSAAPATGAVVVLDPGHNGANGRNPGRIGRLVRVGNGSKRCNTTGTESVRGLTESRFNWLLTAQVRRALERQGATVFLTRHDDRGVGPCVDRRARIANRHRADAAVSIHADGGPSGGRGFHVILPGPVPQVRGHAAILAPSRRLGLAVRSAFRRGAGMPYATYIARAGLDRRTDLGGLNLLTVPGVMIETGNMRNATDAARMSDPAWRRRAGRAIARGILRFLANR